MTATDTPTTTEAEEKVSDRCCYSRFWNDISGSCRCLPSFRAVDIIYRTDGSSRSRMIDVPASFSPPIRMLPDTASKITVAFVKAIVILWKLGVIGIEFTGFYLGFSPNPQGFYFAYLTIWAWTFSVLYSLLSLANTIFPVSTIPHDESSAQKIGVVSRRVSITWAIFTVAASLEMSVSVLFWVLLYDGGEIVFYDLVVHGIIFGLIWVDGIGVNRIPVRLRHWLEICFPIVVLYTIWSVLQSPLVFSVENPYYDDHDFIYKILDWESAPYRTLGIIAGALFVLNPVVHLILWSLALPGRRYAKMDDEYGDSVEAEESV